MLVDLSQLWVVATIEETQDGPETRGRVLFWRGVGTRSYHDIPYRGHATQTDRAKSHARRSGCGSSLCEPVV